LLTAHDLLFYVNGTRVVLTDPDPTLPLADYLRSPAVGLTGTKHVCGEGACGACTVMLSRWDPERQAAIHQAVNSCLVPLGLLDGQAVTTVEGLGSVKRTLHPVQEQIVASGGTQCGFCTPGFVMSMHALLKGNPTPTAEEIESSFDGHICRCTGYRPILDGVHSLAAPGSETAAALLEAETPAVSPKAGCCADKDLPPELVAYQPRPLHFRQGGCEWLRPTSLAAARFLLAAHPGARLVAGNTAAGIGPVPPATTYVDVTAMPELTGIRLIDGGTVLEVGAAVTFSALLTYLERQPMALGLEPLAALLRRNGTVQLRNTGSLGGNLIITLQAAAGPAPFPSDLYTPLVALGATITISDGNGIREAELLHLPPGWPEGAVLLGIRIPLPVPRQAEHFHTDKVASRAQNARAIMNAAFRLTLGHEGAITGATLVFGGVGRLPVRAARAEQALAGRTLSDETLAGALEALRAEVGQALVPWFDGVDPAGRVSLAEALFYKFILRITQATAAADIDPACLSATPQGRPLSRGERVYDEPDPAEAPLREPIVNLNACRQATGEQLYTNDLPPTAQTLSAAVVISDRPHARFRFDPAPDRLVAQLKQQFPGVVDLVTCHDIPAQRHLGIGNDEPLLADEVVTCAGQAIALVVANSERLALQAARCVRSAHITYEDLPAVLTMDQAMAQPAGSGLFPDYPATATWLSHMDAITRPGSDLAWLAAPATPPAGCQVVAGEQRTGAQAHFYLEPQTALAIPGEGRSITVYASTQNASTVQTAVARTLGLAAHNVTILVKPVGGGFGGKTTRPPFIAAAVAVAAHKLNRPVRLASTIATDMAMTGKRHPFLGRFHAAFTPDGTVRGLSTDLWSDGGHTYDCSFFVMDKAQLSADNAYRFDTHQTRGHICRTNKPSSTAMRSFGVIQTTLITETAIERVAHALGMRPEMVRERNFYRTGRPDDHDLTPYGGKLDGCRLPEVWAALRQSCEFDRRTAEVEAFNRHNRWKKRGISMIPLKYGISFTESYIMQSSALVNVYAADGSVLVHHGGIEMGQGLHTKMAQLAAHALSLPLSRIRVAESNTEIVPNTVGTGASTGTDLNGGAIIEACRILKERLESYCASLDGTDRALAGWREHWADLWPRIVAQAWRDRVDLGVRALYGTPGVSTVNRENPFGHCFAYYTYSAGCSEVEIDVLTGETTILRSDLFYDAGKSLSPLVDIGQVEGAFIQGVGFVTTEEVKYDPQGRMATASALRYKAPCAKSIPLDLRVRLWNPADATLPPGPAGVRSSKATGEPPLVLATTVFFAIRQAIAAARRDQGLNGWFDLEAPATVARIRQACGVRSDRLRLK
jgi:xanthine dehydrogenase/oxidase